MASTTTFTVSSLPRISAAELSQILLTANPSSNVDKHVAPGHVAIVDVRDHDHVGGHIRHSTHVPSSTLDHKIPELVRKLADKEIVVFHCALSQQRGPKAALQYLRERERLRGGVGTGESSGKVKGVGEKMMVTEAAVESRHGDFGQQGDEEVGGEDDGEWEVVDEAEGQGNEMRLPADTEGDYGKAKDRNKGKEQKVYLLTDGFVGWQEKYGEDSRLTEGYVKDIWMDY